MKPLKILNSIIAVTDENSETIDSSNTTTTSPIVNRTMSLKNDNRVFQNYRLVWLDSNLNEMDNDHIIDTVGSLRQIINSIDKFTDIDQCIEFIQNIEQEKIFFICSWELAERIVPVIHSLSQINAIYIVYENIEWHENWTQDYFKIKGIFTDIGLICKVLKDAVTDYEHNTVSFSLVKTTDGCSKENLDLLDKSFMYTQILKEIILTIDFEQKHIDEFLSFCREIFVDNIMELRDIDKVEKQYFQHEPIWWYTYQSFLYPMLNRALRLMEVDIIIKMGFFLKDVHNHIVELHSQQFNEDHDLNSFIVYRGQGLSQTDFDELKQTQGGLFSFNNFLSTSTDREVSFSFALRTVNTSDLVGVLFVMQINPSVSTTPFANVKDVSYYKVEDEILFSMHSIFRIGQIRQLNGNTRLWEIELILTSDNDPQLHALTKRIREETFPLQTGWKRLGNLLIQLGRFDKAQQVCDILLDQTTDENEKGKIYYMFARVYDGQGKYKDAVQYYEQSIKIKQQSLSPTHPYLSTSYSELGLLYDNIGEHSKALSYYEKVLEISRTTLSKDHPHLAISYKNIGWVHDKKGEYAEALSYYEKALEIEQNTLPENHPCLTTYYVLIGMVYMNIKEYPKALSYCEKALEIAQIMFPENHPDLVLYYNNIGTVYMNMGEYSEAISFYEKALEISKRTLPEDHPQLAGPYNCIGSVYDKMNRYSEALSYYQKALEIAKKTLPENHLDLVSSYGSIAMAYASMKEYSEAILYCEKILHIYQEACPENSYNVAVAYNNIGWVHDTMGEYSKALIYYKRALEIYQELCPKNHPDLTTAYNNIGLVYDKMGEYSAALPYYEKALEIYQEIRPENHLDLATSYKNIGGLYDKMGEYSTALPYYVEALEIQQKTLPENHPDLATTYNNIACVYDKIGEYSQAFFYNERALEIYQEIHPENHPDLATSYKNIGWLYDKMGEYFEALSYYEKTLEIEQKILPENHLDLATTYNSIARAYRNINDYKKALQYYERTLDIIERLLPSDHPDIEDVKQSIEVVKEQC